jgi:hypothetical protein
MSDMSAMPGVYGAKRASWREYNPRELFRKIYEANPHETEPDLRRLFRQELETHDPETYGRAIVEYFLDSVFRALNDASKETRRKTQAGTQNNAKAAIDVAVKERVQREAQVILMDLLMPNGKLLGECTGSECKKFGGWLIGVSKVAGRKRVADALTEGQVRKIWLSHKETSR